MDWLLSDTDPVCPFRRSPQCFQSLPFSPLLSILLAKRHHTHTHTHTQKKKKGVYTIKKNNKKGEKAKSKSDPSKKKGAENIFNLLFS